MTSFRIIRTIDFYIEIFPKPIARNFLHSMVFREHPALLRRAENESAAVIARRYAEHLLRPLLDEMTYLIGTYPEARLVKCCDVEHPLSGHCGDTSFGLQNGWHGKLDILIMDKDESGQPALGLPVFSVESFDDDDNVSVSSANSYDNHKDNSWAQSIAETIVFSFLQRKQYFGNLQNCLIPGIGISSEKLVVFMYDCENDVLLASVGMDLFDKGDVHMRTIIFLWLVLNYKLFCSGVIDDFKRYRANFHRLVGDEKLEQYKTEVSFPFCIYYTKNKRFDPNKLYTPKNLKRSLDYPEIKSLKLLKKQ